MPWLLILLVELVQGAGTESVGREVVTVKAGVSPSPFEHYWENVVGAGHAGLHLRQDFQDHLRTVATELGFRAVRCHGIFGDALQVCRRDEQGQLRTNWQNVDAIYDAYLAMGVRPFIEISFMPAALASGSTTVFTYRGNVTPPRDWGEWAWLVTDFARHLLARYGAREVRTWPFEVWNEPDMEIFWAGTEEEYFKLYETTAEALRTADPHLLVGGPAAASPRLVTRWLAYAAKARSSPLPVDFISFHTYGGNIRGPEATYAPIGVLSELTRKVADLRDRSPYAGVPLHVTEWNSTPESRDSAHDTPLNGAFVCEAVARMNGRVRSFAYWTVSDVFEERGYPEQPFHGGFGLLSIHGLRKPSFNAFALLHRLGDQAVPVATSAPEGDRPDPGLATIDSGGAVKVLIWNWPFVRPRAPAGKRTIQLVVEGLEASSYLVRTFVVDESHGNVVGAWRAMGAPRYPAPGQLDGLRRADDPVELPVREVKTSGGMWSVAIDLEPGAVRFLSLQPASR